MDPIVYRKDAFPIELSRSRSYTDFSVGWNDGLQKFCVRQGSSYGWRYDVTTRGAYATFAEAYAAAAQQARELAAFREESNDVCILDREDNKKKLVGSWGLSRAQSEELTAPPEENRRYGRLMRAGLQHSFDEMLEQMPEERVASMKRSFLASMTGSDGQDRKLSSEETKPSNLTEGAIIMKFHDFLSTSNTLAMVVTVEEYMSIKPLLQEHYSADDIAHIDEYCEFKPRSDRFLLCNPAKKKEIITPMMYLNAVTFVDRIPFKDIDFSPGVTERKPPLEDTLRRAAARQAEGAKAPAQTKGEKGRS